MRSPYSETNPGCRQENLIATSVMCIKCIYRGKKEGKKSNMGGREGKRVNCLFTVYKSNRHNH